MTATYVVARAGTALTVGDIRVKVISVTWPKGVTVEPAIPGLTHNAVAKLAVTNLGTTAGKIGLTQFWLLDAAKREYLAARRNNVSNPLITSSGGRTVGAGKTTTGTLVFPTPIKFTSGYVMAYQFKDAKAIAKATEIGLAGFK